MEDTVKIIIPVLKNAINKTPRVPLLFSDDKWNEIYQIANRHHLLPCVYHSLRNSEVNIPRDIFVRFRNAALEFALIDEQQTVEIRRLFDIFSENAIDYLPLKGVVIKSLYPSAGMRPMGDVDILIRTTQYQQIRKVLADNGYSEGKETNHEHVWYMPQGLVIELHKRLVSSRNADLYRYYKDPWKLAIKETNHRYKLSDEDTYVYLFAHFAKHYRASGVGIRHMLDIWVYKKAHPELDMGAVYNALSIMGLIEFYENVWYTLRVWFDNETTTCISDTISAWVFSNESLSNSQNEKMSSLLREAGNTSNYRVAKLRLIIRQVFPGRELLESRYPYSKVYPALLSCAWIAYIIKGVTIRIKKLLLGQKHKPHREYSHNELDEYRKHLEMVGIKMK